MWPTNSLNSQLYSDYSVISIFFGKSFSIAPRLIFLIASFPITGPTFIKKEPVNKKCIVGRSSFARNVT